MTTPEFSHEIELETLSRRGGRYSLSADEEARAAIAKRLGLPAVSLLEGDFHVTATKAKIGIFGNVRAALTSICVASLEEMEERIDEPFEIEFVREAPTAPLDDEDDEDLLAPELHDAPTLDIGELLVQQLSLAMAAYPRKEGVVSLADRFGREEESSALAEALRGAIKESGNQ